MTTEKKSKIFRFSAVALQRTAAHPGSPRRAGTAAAAYQLGRGTARSGLAGKIWVEAPCSQLGFHRLAQGDPVEPSAFQSDCFSGSVRFGWAYPLGDFRFFCWGITTQNSVSAGEKFWGVGLRWCAGESVSDGINFGLRSRSRLSS